MYRLPSVKRTLKYIPTVFNSRDLVVLLQDEGPRALISFVAGIGLYLDGERHGFILPRSNLPKHVHVSPHNFKQCAARVAPKPRFPTRPAATKGSYSRAGDA